MSGCWTMGASTNTVSWYNTSYQLVQGLFMAVSLNCDQMYQICHRGFYKQRGQVTVVLHKLTGSSMSRDIVVLKCTFWALFTTYIR